MTILIYKRDGTVQVLREAAETTGTGSYSVVLDPVQIAEGDDVICPKCGHCFETEPIPNADHARTSTGDSAQEAARKEPVDYKELYDDVRVELQKLDALLADPHPGLFTWMHAVNNQRGRLLALLTEGGTPPLETTQR